MNTKDSLDYLLSHMDERVVTAAFLLAEKLEKDRKMLEVVKESLTDIRMNVRYIVFDLEATRRERDALQRKLDDRN